MKRIYTLCNSEEEANALCHFIISKGYEGVQNDSYRYCDLEIRFALKENKRHHRKYELTSRQADYLRENYHLKTNKELADFIGCGLTKLREFARELGLTKKDIA